MDIFNEIIFIDAGGTKILGELWVFTETWSKTKSIKINKPSNIIVNKKQTIDNIKEIILNLNVTNKKNTKVVLSIAGLVHSQSSIKELEDELRNINIFNFEIHNDVEFLFYAFQDVDLISIFGTGSSHIVKQQKNIKIIGGWGHILGDEGSSYSLSLKFIKKALEEIDFSLEPKYLEHVYKYLNVFSRNKLLEVIYNAEDKTIISNLLLFLKKHLKESKYNSLLNKIIKSESDEVIKIYKKIFSKYPNIKSIFINGGNITNEKQFLKNIENFLESKNKQMKITDWSSTNEDNPIYSYLQNLNKK